MAINTDQESMTSKYSLPCLNKKTPFVCKGEEVKAITCEIPASVIIPNIFIPYDEPSNPDGYQREKNVKRITALGKSLIKTNINFPTSIVVNIRNEEAQNAIEKGKFIYRPEFHREFVVMDGQHRLLSMQYAIENCDDKERIDYLNAIEFTVTVTFTENILFEMQMFQDINDNAKPIPALNKVNLMLKRITKTDEELATSLENKGENWKIIAGRVAEELVEDTNSVWYKRIKFPASKVLSPNVTLHAISRYFGEVIKSPKVAMKGSKKQRYSAEIINAYWDGFRNAFPHMFDENAGKYTVQSSLGCHIIMKLWPLISEWILDNDKLENKNLREAQTYEPAFEHLLKNCKGTNVSGKPVHGHLFWLRGKEGYVGAYSSEGGKKILFDQLSKFFIDS